MSVTGYTKAGADTAFAPRSTAWQASTAVKAGQLLTHGSTTYTVNADMTTPSSFNTTGLTVVGDGVGSGGASLTPTAVKTGAYTAAVGDLVPVDATSAAVTITLPTAPADKSQVEIKKIDASTNAVTIARGGSSDVFNKAGGSTSLALTNTNQATMLQYSAGTGIWYVVAGDLPLSGLAQLSNATPQAPGTAGPGTATDASRSDHVHPRPAGIYPWAGDASDGDIVFDGTSTISIPSNSGGSYTPSSNTYTVSHPVFGRTVTINAGVTVILQGVALHASGTLTVNGTIKNDGGNASGATGGTAGNGAGTGGPAGSAGATGGTGAGAQASNAGSSYPWFGGSVSAGGTGSSGSGGAAQSGAQSQGTGPTSPAAGHYRLRTFPTPFNGLTIDLVIAGNLNNVNVRGGYGGSAGGGDGTNAGGGGGGGAGVVIVNALKIAGSGTIRANGGNGAAGVAGNTGGGAAGGGGVVLVNTTSDTSTITYQANAGSPGAGAGTGTAGGTSFAGVVQKIVWP